MESWCDVAVCKRMWRDSISRPRKLEANTLPIRCMLLFPVRWSNYPSSGCCDDLVYVQKWAKLAITAWKYSLEALKCMQQTRIRPKSVCFMACEITGNSSLYRYTLAKQSFPVLLSGLHGFRFIGVRFNKTHLYLDTNIRCPILWWTALQIFSKSLKQILGTLIL